MEQQGIPMSIAVIIAAAILGAVFLMGTVISAIFSQGIG